MFRYVISFSKDGYIRYSSHLDLFRIFKRAFRRCNISLQYSQGFNPHPKMGFAQPLSLGYRGGGEFIEFETKESCTKELLITELQKTMPEGIKLTGAGTLPEGAKSLAASIDNARYTISYPVSFYSKDYEGLLQDYLAQREIMAEKRQKKTKQMVEVNIKNKIRTITVKADEEQHLELDMLLDCGSNSNLSPELVISSFNSFADINCDRYEIEVSRDSLGLPVDYKIDWM